MSADQTNVAAGVDENTIASRLRGRLDELGLSLSDVAEKLGVSKALLGHWTAGTQEPPEARLSTLARYLGLAERWLATGKGPRGCEYRTLTPAEERLVGLRAREKALAAEAKVVRAEIRRLAAEQAEAQAIALARRRKG